jgi:hypothetical protein
MEQMTAHALDALQRAGVHNNLYSTHCRTRSVVGGLERENHSCHRTRKMNYASTRKRLFVTNDFGADFLGQP